MAAAHSVGPGRGALGRAHDPLGGRLGTVFRPGTLIGDISPTSPDPAAAQPGTSPPGPRLRGGARPARVLEERLHLGAGFGAEERSHVLEICPLSVGHLARWSPEQVDLEISVKNRGGRELKVTLEAWLPRWPSLVATSTDRELDHALIEVRNDMIRQIEDEKIKRELGKPPGVAAGARLTAVLTGSGANVSRCRATLAVKSHPLGR